MKALAHSSLVHTCQGLCSGTQCWHSVQPTSRLHLCTGSIVSTGSHSRLQDFWAGHYLSANVPRESTIDFSHHRSWYLTSWTCNSSHRDDCYSHSNTPIPRWCTFSRYLMRLSSSSESTSSREMDSGLGAKQPAHANACGACLCQGQHLAGLLYLMLTMMVSPRSILCCLAQRNLSSKSN